MRTSIVLYSALLLVSLVSANADTVCFETASWNEDRRTHWVGKLDHIDATSGIAYFTYQQGSNRVPYRIHVSRILSLTVDSLDSNSNDFPATRQRLESALASDPQKRRSIKLTNDDQIASRLPPALLVTPGLDSDPIYLHGEIKSIDANRLVFWAIDKKGTPKDVTLERRYLKQWVR